MKKVILIYPEGRKIGNYPNQKGHDYTLQLPISLLPIAFYLQRGGYDPVIFDARVEDYRKLSFEGVICAGISVMTGIQITNALEIAKYIRSVNSKIPIVWGGIHPSLLPEQTVSHDLVDIVVKGEGEATMLDLVRHLEARRSLRGVLGITYRENGSIVSNPHRDFIDLDELQQLPYEFFDIGKYKSVILSDLFFLNTSRGCPHNCVFCYNLSFNRRKWRFQSSPVVVEQIEKIVRKYKVKKFYFATEDNFFVDRQRVENICRGIIQRGIQIEWQSFCRADYFAKFSDDFLRILKKGGCKTLFFGGESGSPSVLSKINKEISPEDLVVAAKKCGDFDIKPIFSFITGFPFEKKEDIKKTFAVIDRIIRANEKAEINGLFVLIPYPGTPIFEEAKRFGLKAPETLEGWARFQFSDVYNLPWLERKEKYFLNTIFRLSTFPFYSRQPNFPPALNSGKTDSIIIKLKKAAWIFYWLSARIRWHYKLFAFPLEWKLYGWYARRKRIW